MILRNEGHFLRKKKLFRTQNHKWKNLHFSEFLCKNYFVLSLLELQKYCGYCYGKLIVSDLFIGRQRFDLGLESIRGLFLANECY